MKSIGESIREMREAKGLTQREVASKIYVADALICAIEHDAKQPSLNVALALADLFDTDVETLLGRK